MQATKKMAVIATLFTGVTMGTASAHQNHNHGDNAHNGHHDQRHVQPYRPGKGKFNGTWKKTEYQRGPIKKITIKPMYNNHGRRAQFRVNIWGDCAPHARRDNCFRSVIAKQNFNGKLKARYNKGKRNVVLKISREGRKLNVVRKVKRHGMVVRRTEQTLKRARGWGQYGHGYRKPDLAITYANGRWNRRLQCYEVTATIRNVGGKMSKPTVVRAVNSEYGTRNVKKQKIGRLQPGQTRQVKLIFNQRIYNGVTVEVNPGRRVQERNYRNNTRIVY